MRRLIGFAIRDIWYKLGKKKVFLLPSVLNTDTTRNKTIRLCTSHDAGLSFRQPQDLLYSLHGGSNPGDDIDPWRGTEKSHHPYLLWHDHVWTCTLWKLPQGSRNVSPQAALNNSVGVLSLFVLNYPQKPLQSDIYTHSAVTYLASSDTAKKSLRI